MPSTVLDTRIAERDQTIAAARAMAESESFDPKDATYIDLQTRATELDASIAALAGLLDQQAAADAFDGKMSKAAQTRQQNQPGQVQTRESWGEAFVRSEQFTNYRMQGSSGYVEVEYDVQTRALPTGVSDLVAAGLTGGKTTVDTTPPPAPTPLLDALSNIPVTTNSIEYVRWAKTAGGAATVAEKAPKPSAEWAPEVTPDTLEMIAVHTELTRQMMEDYVSVRAMIDGELRREVAREEEEHAAAALVAATLPTTTGDDLLSSIRKGIGKVQAIGYFPNAVLLNPDDWADLDIGVMGATLLGPQIRQNFWGLTPVAANSQPAGTATVGDFKAGVQHFYRSQINLFVTDSHAENFLANVFTLLAERRSKTAVVRPQAMVECAAA